MLENKTTLPNETQELLLKGDYERAKTLIRACGPGASTAEYPQGCVFTLKGIDENFGRWLVESGEDINKLDCRGYTPLMYMAGEYDCPETLRLYVKLGADLNFHSPTAGTALNAAAVGNKTENILALLALNIDTTITDIGGHNCLDSLMEHAEGVFAADYYANAKLLAEKGIPITDCARSQLKRIYAEIEKNGANFSDSENAKIDEIMPVWCRLFGVELSFPIVRIKQERVKYTKPYAIFNAIRYGDFETVKKMVEEKPELANAVAPKKPTDTKGMSALQVALTTGWHSKIAWYLLENGADVNYPGYSEGIRSVRPVPLLHDAVNAAVSNCRRYCLDDPDTGTYYKWYGSKEESDNAFEFLCAVLNKGANADIRDEYDDNAITVAVFQALYTCFPVLNIQTGELTEGIKVTQESTEDMKRIFRVLIEAGADTNPRDNYSKKTLEQTFGRESIWSVYREVLKELGKEIKS